MLSEVQCTTNPPHDQSRLDGRDGEGSPLNSLVITHVVHDTPPQCSNPDPCLHLQTNHLSTHNGDRIEGDSLP